MSTTVEVNINWSVFDTTQRQQLENAIQNGHYEQLAAILFEVTPEQAQEIEKVQRQLRPREFTFESQSQKEFEIWSTQNFNDITPEKAAEWQEKIDAEKLERLTAMNGGIVEATSKTLDGSDKTVATVSNDLHAVKGLGEASIKRLNAANIYAVDELRKLSTDDRKKILGPLVASKLTSLI